MNIFQKTARNIISKSFHLFVWMIEQFYNMHVYEQKMSELEQLPEGTLGNDIAACLKRNRLRLVPGYESHDLKHVLLNYKMTPADEIRMQAFMLGNGNYTIASISIFLFGAILLPDLWRVFYTDFLKGRRAQPIKSFTIEAYAHCATADLRAMIVNTVTTSKAGNRLPLLVKTGAYAAIVLGILGMMFCLPFLFSARVADLIGAGLPFIGGAIIAGSGLIALSNLARQTKSASVIMS